MGNELEVKIQDEIRKKVIEEDFKRGSLEGSDNMEALAQISSLPPDEVQRIAKEVRVEQTLKQTYKKIALIGAGVAGVAAATIGAVIYLIMAL